VADDIIRQHKMACLRVTALLACRDRLWVGTSAGVILTLPLPKLTLTSTKATVSAPTVTGIYVIVCSYPCLHSSIHEIIARLVELY